MKRKIMIFFGFLFWFVLLCAILNSFAYSSLIHHTYKNKINSEKIKSIKIGMTPENVISILGKPLKIENKNIGVGKTYAYTKPLKYSMTYPMLWIHFDDKMKVNCVFAKEYILWGGDNNCVYNLDSENANYKKLDTWKLESIFK